SSREWFRLRVSCADLRCETLGEYKIVHGEAVPAGKCIDRIDVAAFFIFARRRNPDRGALEAGKDLPPVQRLRIGLQPAGLFPSINRLGAWDHATGARRIG